MKTLRHLPVLAVVSVILLGCGDTTVVVQPAGPPPSDPPPAPGVVVDEQSTLAEIDAAGRLNFPSDRKERFKSLASRRGLGPQSQVRLVDFALDKLVFSSDRQELLRLLIDSPGFCNAAKKRIIDRLGDLTFDSERKALLDAIDRRGPLAW